MQGEVRQSATGNGNIQAGRDIIVKIFRPRLRDRGAIYGVRRRSKVLYFFLVIFLLCTTLPHPGLNIAASIGAVLLWVAWSLTSHRLARPTLLTFTVFSLLTGCAGPMFADLEYPAIVCGQTQSCKMGAAFGIGILGFGLEGITTDTAKENGGLDKVLASQEIRGYGLISMAQVRVYGE